jgi:hypothetical protein
VRVAVESATIAPVLASAIALVALAFTVAVAGTVKPGLLLDSVTRAPPADAALLRVIVQPLVAFEPSVLGVHTTDESTAAVTRLTVVFAEELL